MPFTGVKAAFFGHRLMWLCKPGSLSRHHSSTLISFILKRGLNLSCNGRSGVYVEGPSHLLSTMADKNETLWRSVCACKKMRQLPGLMTLTIIHGLWNASTTLLAVILAWLLFHSRSGPICTSSFALVITIEMAFAYIGLFAFISMRLEAWGMSVFRDHEILWLVILAFDFTSWFIDGEFRYTFGTTRVFLPISVNIFLRKLLMNKSPGTYDTAMLQTMPKVFLTVQLTIQICEVNGSVIVISWWTRCFSLYRLFA